MDTKITKNYVVILNYNTSRDVIELLNQLINFDTISNIVVVDNDSVKNEQTILKNYIKGKKNIHLLILNDNKGYAIGNNKGIKYLNDIYTINSSDNLIIMNPDISIEEKNFNKTINYFNNLKQNEKVAMCTPVMLNPYESNNVVGWKLPTLITEVSSLYFKKINKKFLKDLNNYDSSKKREFFIECIPGSLLIIDFKKFGEIGYFNEKTFLYCEEDIIGYEFKLKGYKTYIDTRTEYRHMHSKSISSHYDLTNKFKLLLDSKKEYFNVKDKKFNKFKFEFIKINYYFFVKMLLMKKTIQGGNK